MEKINLTESLKKLEEINDWFENQQEVDVENGLEKVKAGVKLVKASRERLRDIENEFEEVKKELVRNDSDTKEAEPDTKPEQSINSQNDDDVGIENIPF